MKKVLVAARNAWAQRIVTLRSSASAGAPKSADRRVETSTKYDGSLKIAAALRSVVSPKLLVLAEGVISGPRRDCILVGAAFALILAVLFNVFAQGRNLAPVPTGALQAGQASMETSSAPTAPASVSAAAAIDAALATTR